MKSNKTIRILSVIALVICLVMCLGISAFAADTQTANTGNVAKVGSTEYATIDEAIANWTNGTTLTLLADVTLSDVIQLSSTEHHILDLGTYTMTAASKKDAIQIVNNGRSSASYALDIKADATNPGGITATGKAVVKTTGKSGVKDRPIIRFYGGVFTGTNVVYHSGSNGTNCPQFWFYGGEYNGTVYANRALFQFYGGTFNGSLQISVDSSAYALVSGGRFKKISNLYGSSLNSDKFTIGSAKGNYDRSIYVDTEGYYVVTSEIITEVSAQYPAVVKDTFASNNYFYYSLAATNGIFYKDASMATGKNVTIWEKPAVTIPDTVIGDAAVVEEIKNNTALKGYTPDGLPTGAELEIELVSVGEEFVYNVSSTATPIKENVTFRLPIPASVTKKYVKVSVSAARTLDEYVICEVKGEGDNKYVEIVTDTFGTFVLDPIVHYEVATYEELIAALANDGAYVIMTADITATATQSSGYGKAGIVVDAGDVLDGNGKKLTINGANTTWDCAIAMRGGEVKNLTIAGAMRGVFMPGANGDVVIDNCVFEDVIYTFNSDAGSKDYTVSIKNSTINGWTSFSNVHKAVTFESCTFGEGNGYAFCRPYQATTFVDCAFEAGFELDTKSTTDTLEFTDCTYNGVEISSENNAMFYNGGNVIVDGVVTDVTIYPVKIGTKGYATIEEAFAAANDGDTITLLADVALDAPLTITKSITIDGNGKKITQSATCNNTYALLYFDAADVLDITVKNVTFDSIKSGAVIRTLGANMTIDNCVFQNCEHSQVQGMLRLTEGKASITNCQFLNNSCSMIISFNYDTNGLAGDTFLVEDCVFQNNTANSTAAVYYVKGAGCTITNSEFISNKVNCSSNGATIYLGFQEDCVVTGNIFKNNTVTDSTTSTRVAGAIFFGYEAQISGNTFVGNTATNSNGAVLGQVCTSTYYDCTIDLSGNYWGGAAPVYGVDYTVQHQTGDADFAINNYYTDANLSEAVTITYVAKVGKFSYTTLDAAINAANGSTVTLLADITLTETVTIPAGATVVIDLGGKTITYNSTIQGETMITNNGNLTINDSVGTGVIYYNYTGAADPSYGKGNYTISNQGTLTINGGKITIANLRAHAKYPINNNSLGSDATLIINGGHLYNYNTSAIRMICSSAYDNTVIINGGLVEGYCAIWVQNPGKNTTNANLTITGGEIKTTAAAYVNGTATLEEVSSRIYFTTEGGAWSTDSSVSITGGIFNENINFADDNPQDITIGEGATFNGRVELPVYVAEVNGIKYKTFAQALAAAEAGDTITLLAPIVVNKGETLELDLAGKTISVVITEQLTKSYAMITNKGTLTINDSIGGGKISLNYTANSFGYGVGLYTISNEGGTLVINGGRIENLTTVSGSMYDAIDNNSTLGDTTLTIGGGEIYCSYLAIRQFANSTTYENLVTVNGGKIEGGNSAIWIQNPGSSQPKADVEIIDGTIVGRILPGESTSFDITVSGGIFTVAVPEDFCAEGYIPTANADGTYGVKIGSYVAIVNGTKYDTVEEAIANANGAIVTLIDNINITSTIKILAGTTVTLDLNGKTIDGIGNVRIAIMSYGNLTIKDSSADKTGTIKAGIGTAGNAINICAGSFTFESGNIYSLNNAILIDEQAAVITISGGKIVAEPTTNNSAVFYISSISNTVVNITAGELVGYNGILLWNNTELNISGGSIEAKGGLGIQGNGSRDNTKINISGDVTISAYYAAIYHPQGGELNITGGTLTGWSGVVVKGGKVNISGGKIIATGAAQAYRPVSSGFVDTGDALYIEHYDNSANSENYGTPVVIITGGIFESANGKPVASYVNPNNNIEALASFISGGIFSAPVADEYCAQGYAPVANEDGTYGVAYGLKGAGTESNPYKISTLEDLILFRDSVNAGETKYNATGMYFVLTADIDLAGINWAPIGSAYTDHGFMGNFDGNGFKIKNLTINPAVDSDGYAYAGFFGVTEGVDKDNQNTIKNLVIENVTITTNGHIVAAAIAYPYYTTVENITVCGNIAITGGDYTAVVLAYTRRCTNASNLTVSANAGSYVVGRDTVGGILSDLQTNGGLVANYANFSVSGITIKGNSCVGAISGIISGQTLNGATINNVAIVTDDLRAGIVSGALGNTSTISGVTHENVTGATALLGATFDKNVIQAAIGSTYYANFAQALAAANAGDTITLLAPIVVNKGETLVIDLKGTTIIGTPTEAKAYAVITNYGDLTICDSVGGGAIICNYTLAGSTGYAVNTITNLGTLTINGGKIANNSTASNQIGYAIDNNSGAANAILTINGGEISVSGSAYYDAIRMFCNSTTNENSVTVNGGTVSSIWLQNPSDGATDKNTKDVKGSVTITGGTVNGLYLEPSTSFEASITGGYVGTIANFQSAEGRDLTGFISGGTFGAALSDDYCQDGYIFTANGDGTYGVVLAYSVKIGDQYYENLAAALAAAQSGSTITLLGDITEASVALIGGVTLDINGYTITTNSFVVFKGNAIVDNGETKGLVAVSKYAFAILDSANHMIPVWNEDDNGYIFVAVKEQFDAEVNGEDSFAVTLRPSLAGGGVTSADILGDGAADNEITIKLNIYCHNANEDEMQVVAVNINEETIKDAYLNDRAIKLSIRGAKATLFDHYLVEIEITSSTGASSKCIVGVFSGGIFYESIDAFMNASTDASEEN